MNNEQQELLDEAYKNYLFTSEWFPISGVGGGFIGTKANSDEIMTQGLFINICKTDNEFAKTWGLKIEERKLSLEERYTIAQKTSDMTDRSLLVRQTMNNFPPSSHEGWLKENNIPTKLITITYNDKTIESYE